MIRFFQTVVLPAKPTQLLIQTGIKWNQNRCADMAAALAYYALFSLFPLLLVVLSVIASLLGPGSEGFQIIQQTISRTLPPDVHGLVLDTMTQLYQSRSGAGLVGLGLLLLSASTIFAILRNSVDHIWQLPNETRRRASIPRTMLALVMNRLFAFLLVLGTAILLFIALVVNILVDVALRLVATLQENFPQVQLDGLPLTQALQGGTSFFILMLVLGILLKILPSARVAWKDLWLGTLLTALLLKGLQHLVSNSIISVGSQFVSYGVIGSVMILLVWIYLTCAIFLLGCQFSYVYACLFGSWRHLALTRL